MEKEGDSDGRVEQKQMKQLSYELQKKKGNAPKRISKIEAEMERLEAALAKIDDEMMAKGSDLAALQDLQAKREEAIGKVDKLMAEWEELEQLLAS